MCSIVLASQPTEVLAVDDQFPTLGHVLELNFSPSRICIDIEGSINQFDAMYIHMYNPMDIQRSQVFHSGAAIQTDYRLYTSVFSEIVAFDWRSSVNCSETIRDEI